MTTTVIAAGEGGFHAPTIDEFFPEGVLFEGTIFELNRIRLVMIVMTIVVGGFFWLAFRKPQVVPRGLQNVGEVAIDFVKFQIVDEVIGKEGRRFLPYLTTLFFLILAFNIAGIIPPLQIAGTSVIALPMLLAICTWVLFNYTGIKEQGLGHYLKVNLFPSGLPKVMYVLVTPIEFASTFILRPVTLTLRLLGNMMAGHMVLLLFFAGTSYLLFDAGALLKPIGLLSFGMGFAFTAFEILVAVLQAYIFTLLTAVYLAGAMSAEH
ncbi:ATP synthase F0 subunit A [Carbonactinospora thermoautotrophica]|uniref:ATP synthase subunit a n=1 Tax=Carbonactinospora thermoautotrophica TaxID=1469144 RepID=A0A132N2C7_9ACTN|nr:ATP synthase F0F1 subunit A [Carbonactinospora thermoautotrophica]KWX06833.1 ATP synthase F0F1 subunit A [Carbonactinospora thermoautotrophica]MCX9191903.1 ATP synthase F0 subunit A [Carbonactinospora thermoautotrophica]